MYNPIDDRPPILECKICYQAYDAELDQRNGCLRRPMIGLCGHSICSACRQSLFKYSKNRIPLDCCREAAAQNIECPSCSLGIKCPQCRNEGVLSFRIPNRLIEDNLDPIQMNIDEMEDRIIRKGMEETKELEKKLEMEREFLLLENEIFEKKEEIRRKENLLKEGRKCLGCWKKGFSARKMRLCLECTSEEILHVSRRTLFIRPNKEEEAFQMALCDFCHIQSKHQGHRSLSMLELERLAQFEYETERIRLVEGNQISEEKNTEIFKLKTLFQKAKNEEESKNILKRVEAVIKKKYEKEEEIITIE